MAIDQAALDTLKQQQESLETATAQRDALLAQQAIKKLEAERLSRVAEKNTAEAQRDAAELKKADAAGVEAENAEEEETAQSQGADIILASKQKEADKTSQEKDAAKQTEAGARGVRANVNIPQLEQQRQTAYTRYNQSLEAVAKDSSNQALFSKNQIDYRNVQLAEQALKDANTLAATMDNDVNNATAIAGAATQKDDAAQTQLAAAETESKNKSAASTAAIAKTEALTKAKDSIAAKSAQSAEQAETSAQLFAQATTDLENTNTSVDQAEQTVAAATKEVETAKIAAAPKADKIEKKEVAKEDSEPKQRQASKSSEKGSRNHGQSSHKSTASSSKNRQHETANHDDGKPIPKAEGLSFGAKLKRSIEHLADGTLGQHGIQKLTTQQEEKVGHVIHNIAEKKGGVVTGHDIKEAMAKNKDVAKSLQDAKIRTHDDSVYSVSDIKPNNVARDTSRVAVSNSRAGGPA